MDLNGARRKNATRETTSTLKAWLNEHKKNPYPTKGEKIMLAIITKMTLTQVSTWFANARRRLKKENKMTWEPRNRVEDDDVNLDDDDHKSNDDKDMLGKFSPEIFLLQWVFIEFDFPQILELGRVRMVTDRHEWTCWTDRLETTLTGASQETGVGQTRQTSTIALECPIRIPYSIRQRSIIFVLHTQVALRPTQTKLRLAIPTQIQSTSPEFGRWLTWPARKVKMNLQTCLRTLEIHIIRPGKFYLHWLPAASIPCIIRTWGLSCIEISMVLHTCLRILMTLQSLSRIKERSVHTTECLEYRSARSYRKVRLSALWA